MSGDRKTTRDRAPEAPAPRTPQPEEAPALASEALLRGRSQVRILHRGEWYSLRETRNGKLILTK